MTTDKRRPRPVWRWLLACGLCTLTGCGGLKLVPVSGKAMLGDKPLTGGALNFVPDASKGNNAHVACFGRIGAQGQYELKTAGVYASDKGTGAPLGWYKVTFENVRGSPEIKVPSRYLSADSTPLKIEVVADPKPGQYDVKLDE